MTKTDLKPLQPDLIDMAAIAAFLVCDTAILTLGLHWATVLGLHLVLVFALWWIGGSTPRPMLQITAALGIGGGPIGGAIAALLAIGLRLSHRDPERNADWYRLLSGADFDDPRRTMAQDLLAGRLGGYQPPPRHNLATIFSRGSRGEKQAALRWLAQRDLAEFPDEIRLALDDDDNTIRIEAAALMGRLGNRPRHRADPLQARQYFDSDNSEKGAL